MIHVNDMLHHEGRQELSGTLLHIDVKMAFGQFVVTYLLRINHLPGITIANCLQP